MSITVTKVIMLLGILSFDMAIFFLLRRAFSSLRKRWGTYFDWGYWALSFVILGCFYFLDWIFLNISSYSDRKMVISFIAITLLVKILASIYLAQDNLIKGVVKLLKSLKSGKTAKAPPHHEGPGVSRKQFIYRAALMATSVPIAVKGFSIINQAYDYRIRREKIVLPNLPKAFHGLRIGQISDIHSGSFKNKIAVRGGVDLLLQEHLDMIFFTGDLVNRQSDEIKEYIDVFEKVKAPLGVYSILGNHDYGEYRRWPSPQAKQQDFKNMLEAHKELGWKLLRNENHILTEGSESLAILGVENWGIKRFSKYGKLEEAYAGTEAAAVRLLMSHDPSHWEAKVLDYPDIDMTFSGHTHGFQFGVELGKFRWSPSQYLYKQWAGLYQQGSQRIYVNRGFGFIGMPGRVGITPEITIFELLAS